MNFAHCSAYRVGATDGYRVSAHGGGREPDAAPRPRQGRMKVDDEDEGCAVVDVASLESEPEGVMRAVRAGGLLCHRHWII